MSSQCRVWRSVAAGAVGGLVASFVMNGFQKLWSTASDAIGRQEGPGEGQQSEGEGENATVKTANFISTTIFNHELTDSEKKWAGPAVHYGFGTALGATYGALAESAPIAAAGRGTAYGTGVWLVADEIVVPRLGLSGSPTEAPAAAHVYALASHLVYGLVTDLVRRLVLR